MFFFSFCNFVQLQFTRKHLLLFNSLSNSSITRKPFLHFKLRRDYSSFYFLISSIYFCAFHLFPINLGMLIDTDTTEKNAVISFTRDRISFLSSEDDNKLYVGKFTTFSRTLETKQTSTNWKTVCNWLKEKKIDVPDESFVFFGILKTPFQRCFFIKFQCFSVKYPPNWNMLSKYFKCFPTVACNMEHQQNNKLVDHLRRANSLGYQCPWFLFSSWQNSKFFCNWTLLDGFFFWFFTMISFNQVFKLRNNDGEKLFDSSQCVFFLQNFIESFAKFSFHQVEIRFPIHRLSQNSWNWFQSFTSNWLFQFFLRLK